MKIRNLIGAFAALATLAACQETEALQPEITPKGHTVQIVAGLSELTKTTLSQDGEGKYKCSWEKGDVIYVYERVRGVSSDGNDVLEGGCGFVISEPLETGGETAVFSATFDPYYWENEDVMSKEELADYTFTYTYLASTINPYGLYEDYETGEEFFYLMINREQAVHSEGYGTSNDMLVSKWSVYEGDRPEEISFQFARLGTIVEITLSGLEPGDVLKSGMWYTGEKFVSTVDLEGVLSYYPETGKYRYGFPEYMVEMTEAFNSINFTCEDDRPIVVDAKGEAVLHLRCLPGEIDDWFGFMCDIERGGETLTYSRLVSHEDMAGRTLEFKDAGLTKFKVGLKPAQAETMPEDIVYTTAESEDHCGFIAMWETGAHLSGYECCYFDYYYADGEIPERVYLDVIDMGDGYSGVSVESGMEPSCYTLCVKGIPDDASGPQSFDSFVKLMCVGEPVSLELAGSVTYDGNATLIDEASGLYLIKNRDNWNHVYADEYAYFIASNASFSTSICAKDTNLAWSFQTAYSQVFPGGLESIEFTLGKWYYVDTYHEAKVYGIKEDMSEVLLNDTSAETQNNKEYKYDLTGYAGVKLVCPASATLRDVYLNYYK